MSLRYKLRVPVEIVTLIRTMHPRIKQKIRAALDEIVHDPDCGKPLKLELDGLRSYRVGRFRIIYRIAPEKIFELVAIGPRKNIYEETYRLLPRDE